MKLFARQVPQEIFLADRSVRANIAFGTPEKQIHDAQVERAALPIHAELTTQQAADYLGISRPHLIKLLEGGEIPYRKVGTHRRVYFRDLKAYRDNVKAKRRETLSELVRDAEEHEMGY